MDKFLQKFDRWSEWLFSKKKSSIVFLAVILSLISIRSATFWGDFDKIAEALIVAKMDLVLDDASMIWKEPHLNVCGGNEHIDDANGYGWIERSYQCFHGECACEKNPYLSQPGIAGPLWTSLVPVFGQSLVAYKFVSALLCWVILLSACFLLARQTLPRAGALLFLYLLIQDSWFCFSSNLYWNQWISALLVAVVFLRNHRYFPLIFGGAVFLRFLAGFEYSSVYVLMPLPFFLWDLLQNGKFQWKKWVSTGLLGLGAFAGAFGAWYLRLRLLYGHSNAMDYINTTILRRTHASQTQLSEIDSIYHKSLRASFWETLYPYLVGDYAIPFVIMLAVGIFLWVRRGVAAAWKPTLVYFCAFAVSVSWFALARGHSQIHTHLNFIVWEYSVIPVFFFLLGHYGLQRHGRTSRS